MGLGVGIGNAQERCLSAGLSQVAWAGLSAAMKRKSNGCSESGTGKLFGFTLCRLGHGIWGAWSPSTLRRGCHLPFECLRFPVSKEWGPWSG